jgi:acetyl-CoA carboxylase / biotin carboxylase 1
MGSGLIVGESSAAQDETCTLNYVTARSVWIGAYLVFLGQHSVVQDYVHGISAVGD